MVVVGLSALLVACTGGGDTSSTPDASDAPDNPIFSSGEVIGLVQTFLAGQQHTACSVYANRLTALESPAEYTGAGVWKVGPVFAGEWEVFERSRIVRSLGTIC